MGAYQLSVRRDLGSGIIAQRPGPPMAAPWITRPIGLTLRFQRGALIGWTVGLFAIGAVYGSIGEEIETLIEDNPDLADFLALIGDASLADAYLATSLSMLAMLASGFAISSILRGRSAETAGHAELLVATPTSRWRWMAAQLAVAVGGSIVIVTAAGFGTGLTYAAVTGDASQVLRMVGAALVSLPAVLFLIGVALVLFGWLPRATVAAWGVFAVIVAVGIFGPLLDLPQWLLDLSPFEALPAAPAEDMTWTPVAVVSAIALGTDGSRRRRLPSSRSRPAEGAGAPPVRARAASEPADPRRGRVLVGSHGQAPLVDLFEHRSGCGDDRRGGISDSLDVRMQLVVGANTPFGEHRTEIAESGFEPVEWCGAELGHEATPSRFPALEARMVMGAIERSGRPVDPLEQVDPPQRVGNRDRPRCVDRPLDLACHESAELEADPSFGALLSRRGCRVDEVEIAQHHRDLLEPEHLQHPITLLRGTRGAADAEVGG